MLLPLGDADLALLPVFATLHRRATVARVRAALDSPGSDDPAWMVALRAKLRRYVETPAHDIDPLNHGASTRAKVH